MRSTTAPTGVPRMNLFDEKKATQVVSRLLVHSGGRMNYMKALKLAYLVDRLSLDRWDTPVLYDEIYSMSQGQVLTSTLDLMKHSKSFFGLLSHSPYWAKHINPRRGFYISIKQQAPVDELSESEIEIIDEILDKFGHLDEWALRDLHHELPEYVKVDEGKREFIPYEKVLAALEKSENESARIMQDMKEIAAEKAAFGA